MALCWAINRFVTSLSHVFLKHGNTCKMLKHSQGHHFFGGLSLSLSLPLWPLPSLPLLKWGSRKITPFVVFDRDQQQTPSRNEERHWQLIVETLRTQPQPSCSAHAFWVDQGRESGTAGVGCFTICFKRGLCGLPDSHRWSRKPWGAITWSSATFSDALEIEIIST